MKIVVDADKLEHLLNCMAQLNFVPMTKVDEPIIRKAYDDAREMLHNPVGFGPQTPIKDREGLRAYLIAEENGILTGWVTARMLSAMDQKVLESGIDVISADQGAILDPWLQRFLAMGG